MRRDRPEGSGWEEGAGEDGERETPVMAGTGDLEGGKGWVS